MKCKKAYKYRCYPTEEQCQILAQTFGSVRFVYNWALRLRTDAYFKDSKRLYYHDVSKLLTELKRNLDYSWLRDISSVALQQALRHLDQAFINFFEGRTKYPTYKKKHGYQSVSYMTSGFQYKDGQLYLAKVREPLPIVWSRPLPIGAKPSSVTVSKDRSGRYFVSLLVTEDIQPEPVSPQMVGIDLGIKSMVALSTGETVENPKFLAREERALARAQRQQARKKKGSQNRNKARHKVARIHARIRDKRLDYQHKLSTRIVRENQVICVESLAIKNMVKNHNLAKAIHDVGWGEFVRQLEYKARWAGRSFVRIDRWYPSSKRCYDCGHVVEQLPLSVRTWTCPECGVVHDRDHNAAQNILAAGLAVLACGEAVRPGAVTGSGKSSRSRKAHV